MDSKKELTKDMTKGQPAKLLLLFALPLMLGSLFQQLYTMVDTIIVGQGVGIKALRASIGNSIILTAISAVIFTVAGQEGVFYAEIFAWTGAAAILVVSYYINVNTLHRKFSNSY